jgi:ketosteroid isomerase-like protein
MVPDGSGWRQIHAVSEPLIIANRERIVSTQEEIIEQVRRVNDRFYRAFESLDIEQMAALWVHARRARCVHPGWEMLEGWAAIEQSWVAIFANTDFMRFVITDMAVHLYANVAWVTCVENLSDASDSMQMSRILATNIYERQDGGWRIVHHHASPVLRPVSPPGPGPETLN